MGHAPENTIASFQKALDLGCDEVETDVWLVEGRLIISHDRPARDAKLGLDEMLDFCRGRMGVNVEIKSDGSEAYVRQAGERVAARLAERGDPDVYVSSFDRAALAAARATAPDVRRAFLFSAPPEPDALSIARDLALWAVHPHRALVTPDLVRDAHAAGLRVQAWTVNDPAEISTFREWQVDGIMSDHPERVPKD